MLKIDPKIKPPLDPYFKSDPQYHYDEINDSLKRAAAKLPIIVGTVATT